jgi:hypothetical protein
MSATASNVELIKLSPRNFKSRRLQIIPLRHVRAARRILLRNPAHDARNATLPTGQILPPAYKPFHPKAPNFCFFT